jgi:hypothetical protein
MSRKKKKKCDVMKIREERIEMVEGGRKKNRKISVRKE